MKEFLYHLAGFFFPNYCPVCGDLLHIPGQVICFKCEICLPRTNYVGVPDNPVFSLFWGRVEVERAMSLFRFEKGSAYQALIHQLKYNGKARNGRFLGRLLGSEILGTPFQKADLIVPVPLYPGKERKRGYNQSYIISEGISAITDIPICASLLYRKTNTSSQTKRTRYQRWENMQEVFSIDNLSEDHYGKHFLLVDDVVTTGSTLEGCAMVLNEIPGAKISIVTIACA